MKNVSIVEKVTGKIVATIPIQMAAMSYTPSKEEYEAAAWEAAVDDGSVDRDRFSDYSFRIDDAATSAVGSPPPA
jgi:hypothetical protein